MYSSKNVVVDCNGTYLHSTIMSSNNWASLYQLGIVIGHGLGSRNPKLKSHINDDWTSMLAMSCIEKLNPIVTYTARGHGDSTGWELTAEDDIEQFTWERLAFDMISIADHYKLHTFIASGSSMGSATALYAAIANPSRIVGMILIRPPTAWESRKERSKILASSAKKCELGDPSGKHHLVLRGAGLSDLPLVDDPVYSQIKCPVLILAIEGDPAHPLSTATKLVELLENSELFVSKTHKEATEAWPALIDRFINKLTTNSIFRP